MKNAFLLILCLSLVGCAQRFEDDNAGDDDVVTPNPDPDDDQDPNPDPDPVGCDSDDDCVPVDGCSDAVCLSGSCSTEPACGEDQSCDEDLDACVDDVPTPPGSGSIVCAEVPGFVDVTISGGILGHLNADPAPSPTTSWKLVYGSSPGDWQVPYASGSTKNWKPWTTDGASYTLRLPNSVTSFNIALTNGTDASSEYWLDLNEYVVSGSTCAHVTDGGSVTRTATVVPNGSITCAESGSYVNVTIGAGILNHLKNSDGSDADGTISPTTSWKLMYGSDPGSWAIPYASGSTKDWEYWEADTVSYLVRVTSDVTMFNFALTDGANKYWFDLDEFNVSGSSCAHASGVGGIQRTATTPPPATMTGSIECRMTTVNGVAKREVSIVPLSGHDLREGLAESPSFLPSPSAIQVGYGDWALPYPAGSSKPQLSWINGTATYVLYLDPSVDDFNLFVVDNDDPSDGWSGGDFFLLDKWTVVNVGSAGCSKVGGGISTN